MSTPPGPPPPYPGPDPRVNPYGTTGSGPYAPGPYPPGPPYGPPYGAAVWPPAAPPPRRRRNPALIVATIVTVCLVAAAGVTIWKMFGPKPSAPLTSKNMADVLLTQDELLAAVPPGASTTIPVPYGTSSSPAEPVADPAECVSTVSAGAVEVYPPGSYTDFAIAGFAEMDRLKSLVIQAAARFDSADKAGTFVQQEKSRWEKCANTTVTFANLKEEIGTVEQSGDLIALQIPKRVTPGGYTQAGFCERVVSAVANVVMDVEACTTEDVAVLSARDIVSMMAAKIGA